MSQEDIAARLGLTDGGYGHYERGRQPFTVEMLVKISHILGQPLTWFLDLDTGLSADEGELLQAYRAIREPKARRMALEIVKDAAATWSEPA